MSLEDKLKLCNLTIEIKVERCEELISKYLKGDKTDEPQVKKKRGRPPLKPENVKSETNEPKKRKNSPKLCWGCLEEGNLKNMHIPHYVNGFKELYADMVMYCFSIQVTKEFRLNYICENCIQKLREVLRFRKQFCIAQNYLNQVTGGPAVKTDEATGQFECDIKPPSSNVNGSAAENEVSQKNTPVLSELLQNKDYLQQTQLSTTKPGGVEIGSSPLPIRLIPIQPMLAPSFFVIDDQGVKKPIYIQPANSASVKGNQIILSKPDLMNPMRKVVTHSHVNLSDGNHQFILNKPCGNNVMVLKQKPKSSKGITYIKPRLKKPKILHNSNVVHEIEESSDDDVQVVEDGDVSKSPAEEANISAATIQSYSSLMPNSSEPFIQEEECYDQSDYITCQDFVSP